MELRHIRHVLALAAHRNYARAAQALHITQPALTRSIQSLEASLGAVLFDRGKREVVPTAVGEIVLRHARTIDSAADDLKRDVQLAEGMEVGSLCIGVGPFVGPALIRDALANMTQAYPSLHLQVTLGPWRELPQRLRDREIELMVGEMSDIEAIEAFEFTPLSQGPYIPMVRAGHPLAQRNDDVTIEDLVSFPIIGPTLTPDMDTVVRDFLYPNSPASDMPLYTVTCDSLSILTAVLSQSNAVSFLIPFMVENKLRERQLIAFPHLKTDIKSRYGVAYLRDRTLSAPAQYFCRLLEIWNEKLNTRNA